MKRTTKPGGAGGRDRLVDQVIGSAKKESTELKQRIDSKRLIPTGSTLLNLACSDQLDGGWVLGKLVNLIGDSSSGKTLLGLTMFAEMNKLKHFDNHRFIFDDAEQALEFDIERLFGQEVGDRLEIQPSNTVQDFFSSVYSLIDVNEPFIYLLDSLDALTSEEEIDRIEKRIGATEAQRKKMKGSYKTEKAKTLSEMLRIIVGGLKYTDSLVVIISQTRDNIGVTFGSKKTRRGGRALRFYSSHEIWLAIESRIYLKKRETGINVVASITKNKLTGKRRKINFPIYYDYGLDDIDSCINFLIKEGVWSKKGRIIKTNGFVNDGSLKKVIKRIAQQDKEHSLAIETTKAWLAIEESLNPRRKPKF